MNQSNTNSTNSKLMLSVGFFILFFMFSFSGFSQSQTSANIEIQGTKTVSNVKTENSRATTNIEFAIWFMGTKQDPNTTLSAEGANAKKIIITSGIAPNRVLIKAFLKKVVNYESSLS